MDPLQFSASLGHFVFNYRVCWQPAFIGDQIIRPYTESPPYYVPENERHLHTARWFLPAWSVDLDKALQVIEVMNRKGFDFEMRHEHWGGHWVASFGTNLVNRMYGDSDLPATAICASALGVFGIEVPENQISVRGRRKQNAR